MINNKFQSFHSTSYLNAISTQNQTISAANTPFIWTYNQVLDSRNIEIIDSSKITFRKKGLYNIQFSAQIISQNSNSHLVNIWLKKNGDDVENSCTDYTVVGNGQAMVSILNFLVSVDKDDYYQVTWSDSVNCSLEYIAARTNPVRPAAPSIILTVWSL